MTTPDDDHLLLAALEMGIPSLMAKEAVASVRLDHGDGTYTLEERGSCPRCSGSNTWDDCNCLEECGSSVCTSCPEEE